MTLRREFSRDGVGVRVTCAPLGGARFALQIDDVAHEVVAQRTSDGRVSFELDGRTFIAAVAPAGERGDLHVRLDGRTWRLAPHRTERGETTRAGSGSLEAPMTGTVLAVHVAVGDRVAHGDPVAVVTAMKMEHRILADLDGVVSAVEAKPGDTVEQGFVLVRVEGEAGGAESRGN